MQRKYKKLYPLRLTITLSYWFALSWELLVSNPLQIIFQIPDRTPQWNIASEPISFSLHLSSYCLLGLLLTWSSYNHKKLFYPLYLLAFIHAGLFEWLQIYVPQRWPNILDFIANALGLSLALLLFFIKQKFLNSLTTLSSNKTPHTPLK